jgi:WD40 repeat protein
MTTARHGDNLSAGQPGPPDPAAPAPRRLQVFPVAIGRYADPRFELLDTAAEVRKVTDLLADFGGFEVPWDTGLDQRGGDAVTERLRVWSTPPDEHDTVLYWVGHGWSNRLDASLAHHLSPHEVGDDGLIPRQLASKISAREGHPAGRDTWAIVVVDACTSARFVEGVVSELYADPLGARRVLLVGVSGEGTTRLGVFSAALARCLRNTFRSNAQIPLWDLAGELGRILPGSTVEVITANNLAGAVLTRRVPVAAGFAVTLDVLAEIEAVLATLTEDERRHFVPRAQGGETGEVMSYFSGRERELTTIASWLRTERTGMLVVTGAAGTGKSAILGHLLVQSRPRLREVLVGRGLVDPLPPHQRPADDVFDLALLLTGATTTGVVRRIAAAAGLGDPPGLASSRLVDWLLDELRQRHRPLTLLLDALDEAQHPRTLSDQLIRRLSTVDGVRVVVGTRQSTREEPDRPHPSGRDLLDALTARAGPVRVITVAQDASAVTRYVKQRLYAATAQRRLAAGEEEIDGVATAIAGGGREFLFAKLAIHEILARPGLLTPDRAAERAVLLSGNHRRLFVAAVARLRDRSAAHGALLAALALAQGRGLPIRDGVWGTVASALAGSEVGDHAIDALLRAAAPYLMLDTEDGQSVYRLAHRTFQENFPARTPVQRRHRQIIRALLAAVPAGHRGPLNPYLVRHLSGHLAAAGMPAWGDLAARPDVLDRLDAAALTGDALRTAFGQPELPAEVAGAIAARHLLIAAAPRDRRGLREIAMARHTATQRFPAAVDADLAGAGWAVRWAAVRPTPLHVTLTGHTDWVLALAALTAADGRTMLASGGRDGTVQLWDLATGAPVGDRLGVPEMGWVWALTGVTAGRRTLLASSARDGRVRLWNPVTGRPAAAPLVGHTGPVYAVAEVTEDGPRGDADGSGWRRSRLASGADDGTIRLWNPVTGALTHVLTGHTGPVWAVARVSTPDGPDLLASAGGDGTIRLWQPATGECVAVLTGHRGRVFAVAAVSMPAGPDLLASAGGDGTVRLWNPATGECNTVLIGHTGGVQAVATLATPDRRTALVSGGDDGTVRLWNPVTGECTAVLTGHAGGVQAIVAATTPDRRTLLATGGRDGTVRVWDPATAAATRRPRAAHTGPVRAVAAGPGVVATGGEDGTIRLWHPDTGAPEGALTGHTGWVRAVAGCAGADGRFLLASGSEDGTLRLWDPRTGACEAVLTGHDGWVLAVAGRLPGSARRLAGGSRGGPSGGHLLASGGDDGAVRLWDLDAGAPAGGPLTGHAGWVLAVAAFATAEGQARVASGGDDGTVRLWDPAAGKQVGRTLTGHTGPVWAVAAGPGLLASGGDDGTVRLWDPATGEQMGYPLTGHTGWVRALAAFRGPAGRTRLASGSDDGTVRVWDPAARSTVQVLTVQSEVNALVAAGDTLIAGVGDGVLAFSLNAE